MRVIPPVTINDAALISSNVAEPGAGETAWSALTTYNIGDVAINATTHRKYQSLIASNLNNVLPSYPTQTQNTAWLDIGPTNRWAMFDMIRGTSTVGASSPITVTIKPGERVNSLALLNLVADSVTITGTSAGAGGTVYGPETITLRSRDVEDWYDYFFAPFNSTSVAMVNDIPPYSDLELIVSIACSEASPECGALVVGTFIQLGTMQFGATRDTKNFSTITFDDFGDSTLIQRPSAALISCSLVAANANVKPDKIVDVDTLVDVVNSLNAEPAIWAGLDDTDNPFAASLLISGVYTGFVITMQSANVAKVDLKVQEI